MLRKYTSTIYKKDKADFILTFLELEIPVDGTNEFVKKDFYEIRFKNSINWNRFPVNGLVKHVFKTQWEKYQSLSNHIPLEDIFNRQQCKVLENAGISTVQQFISRDMVSVERISKNAIEWYKIAEKYLEEKNKDSENNPNSNRRVEELERQVELLKKAMPKAKRDIVEDKLSEAS